MTDIHNTPYEAIEYLSNWVKTNTKKGVPSPQFGLDNYLILARDGLREGLEDLVMFTYHQTASFRKATEWKWVEKVSRGLIFEKETGIQISNPFYKFFNYGELPEDEHLVIENDLEYKHDGSLGICFYYKDLWWVTTYGSLNSEQGVFGTECIRSKDLSYLQKHASHMVEIVYPENRIVSNYGDFSGLIYLKSKLLDYDHCYNGSGMAIFDTYPDKLKTFYDWYATGKAEGKWSKDEKLKAVLDFCLNQTDYNYEGFVYTTNEGRKIKFKTKAYLEIHRMRFDISENSIRDLMMNNPSELLKYKETLPNEFYDEVDGYITKLNEYAVNKLTLVNHFVDEIFGIYNITKDMDKRDISKLIHKEVAKLDKDLQSIAWSKIKGQSYDDLYKQALKY